MCNDGKEQISSGSFRETADRVFEQATGRERFGGETATAMKDNLTSANLFLKRRVNELEQNLVSVGRRNDRVLEAFARLGREGIYDDIFIVVTIPGRVGITVMQTEYGPYRLTELLGKFNELRAFDHFLIRHRAKFMPGQAGQPFGDAM